MYYSYFQLHFMTVNDAAIHSDDQSQQMLSLLRPSTPLQSLRHILRYTEVKNC